MSLVYDLKSQSEKSVKLIKKEFNQYISSFDTIKKQESKLIDKKNELKDSLKKYLENHPEYNNIFYKEYNTLFEEVLNDTKGIIKNLELLKSNLNKFNADHRKIKPIYDDVSYNYKNAKDKISTLEKEIQSIDSQIKENASLLQNNSYQLEKYKGILINASIPESKIESYLNNENIYIQIVDKIDLYLKQNTVTNNFIKFLGFNKDEQYEEFKKIEKNSQLPLKEYFQKLDKLITLGKELNEKINYMETKKIKNINLLEDVKKQLKDLNYDDVSKQFNKINKQIDESNKTINIYDNLNTNEKINQFVNKVVLEKVDNTFKIPNDEYNQYSKEINTYIKINNSINEMQDKLKNKMQVESSFYTQVKDQIKKIEETDKDIQKLKDEAKVNDALKAKGISKEKLKKSYDSLNDGISTRTSNNYIYTDIIDTSYMNYMLGLDFYKINMYSVLNNNSMDVNLGNLNTNEFSIFKDESSNINNTIENITDLNNSLINDITNNSLFDDSFISNIDSNSFNDISSFDFNEISDISSIADSISSAPSCSSGPSCSSCSS